MRHNNKDFIGATLTIGPGLKHYGVKGMKWRVKKAAGSNEDPDLEEGAGGGGSDLDSDDEDDDQSGLPSDRYRVGNRPVGHEKKVGSGKVSVHKREKANTGKRPESSKVQSKFANQHNRPVGHKKKVGSGKVSVHKREKVNTGKRPESSKVQSKWR